MLSLNVFSDPGLNFDGREANLNDAGVGGLNLDVEYNFTIPPDYTAGTPLTVRVLAYARSVSSFPCNGGLGVSFVYAARADAGEISDGTSSLQPSNLLHVFTAPNVHHEYAFTLDTSGGFQAGDAVTFGLFGEAPGTACNVYVTGLSILYI